MKWDLYNKREWADMATLEEVFMLSSWQIRWRIQKPGVVVERRCIRRGKALKHIYKRADVLRALHAYDNRPRELETHPAYIRTTEACRLYGTTPSGMSYRLSRVPFVVARVKVQRPDRRTYEWVYDAAQLEKAMEYFRAHWHSTTGQPPAQTKRRKEFTLIANRGNLLSWQHMGYDEREAMD